MVDQTLPLPGLPPVAGKEVVARFDGGWLVLREIERRLEIAGRLAACALRSALSRQHRASVADIIRFWVLRGRRRCDRAAHRSAVQADARTPAVGAALVFAIDHRAVGEFARAQTLLRLGRALVDVWCGSFRQMPRRIKLDIDDTFDAVHGDQQLRACSTSITTTMASSRS